MIHSGYTKLFSNIVASTIWREDDKTRLVWITLLALSDRDGYVAASLPGLADLAHVSIEDCEMAIGKLQQPDKYSRSPEHDGRRIEAVEGGWLILNRAKYRDLVPAEHRREVDRLRQQRHRKKQNVGETTVTMSRVKDRDSHVTSRKTETKTKTEIKNIKHCSHPTVEEVATYCQERENQIDPQQFFDYYSANGWRVGRNPMKDWRAAVRTWEKKDLGSRGLSKTEQRTQRNRETLVAALREVRAEDGMRKGTTLVRPSDAQFIGLSPEFPPCPFGECDGSSWYIERGTRARIECRCAQTRKASTPEPVIDAAS
jgi:hypothetical protein